MVKYKRQARILKIIDEKDIKTHSELIDELEKSGFNVTQATVSRDIKELGLVKVHRGKGSVYAPSDTAGGMDAKIGAISDTVKSIDYANNCVVVKTYPGMASAVAASVDASMRGDILGSVAGDDTLLIITRNEEASANAAQKLALLFRQGEITDAD